MSKTEPPAPPETTTEEDGLPPLVPGGTDYYGKGAKPKKDKRT